MLDVINRADKRGLFDSIDQIRTIKDLRNRIAHEYAKEELESLYGDVMRLTPDVFTIAEKIHAYCSRYVS